MPESAEELDKTGYVVVAALDDIAPGALDNYGPAAAKSIEQRGGVVEAILEADRILEGEVSVSRLVVIRFASRSAALDWYNGAEYGALIPERQAGCTTQFMIGFSPMS